MVFLSKPDIWALVFMYLYCMWNGRILWLTANTVSVDNFACTIHFLEFEKIGKIAWI